MLLASQSNAELRTGHWVSNLSITGVLDGHANWFLVIITCAGLWSGFPSGSRAGSLLSPWKPNPEVGGMPSDHHGFQLPKLRLL